ncbi:DUF294 nucleotidyltransferase-like domain-containing protein [Sediminibacillus massiliensis]|uniref:DUF294 nucleotidyltransferase-like domain-containing protein n=1 Tax=Sediminibacillus massiliensis TaxID=1926277 RepID=UPI001FE8D1DA|nr:DUF294 nucleotidyltransferase-like domain-containing protein [Sediminibacillus massiliensis]
MLVLKSYVEIKRYRDRYMSSVSSDHKKMNLLHDELIRNTVHVAMDKVQEELGGPPAPFAFFLMGSAGRFEQSVWSDQDHGIVFDGEDSFTDYFLALGEEITHGLATVKYEYCDGKVMSSNPLWCRSVQEWKKQLSSWLEKATWESLRHFSTFFDSRVLLGESSMLRVQKQEAFSILQNNPGLYIRLMENFDFIKKGIGIFGQLLPEQHGLNSGNIHLKQTAFFPYVNSLRLLALKNQIYSPSTLSRFKQLPDKYQSVKSYEGDFVDLLQFRLHFRKDAKSYKEVHHVPLNSMGKNEKHQLKQLMKHGYKLFDETKKIIENECST